MSYSATFRTAALLVLLPAFRPAAGQNAGEPLGVYRAIEVASEQSPALNGLRERIRARQAQRWTAFGINAPSLTYFREGISTGSGGFEEQRIGLSQTVDFPLRSYYRVRRIDTEGQGLALELEAEQARLKSTVKKAYTDLLYAQELLHLRAQEMRLARDLLDAARVRVEVGEASELEQIKAEIQLAEAQTGLEEARSRFQNSRYTLFNAIGLDPEDQRYEITFPDTLAYVETDIDQGLVMDAIGRQPEWQSADRFLEAARLGLRQTRSSLWPDFQFDVYPQDLGGGFNRFGFQIGLRLPLWFIPSYRGSMRAARADIREQTWARQGVLLDLKKEAEQAWHGYETSREAVRRYVETIRSRTEILLERTQEGYLLGELDLLTLLDAQRTYLAGEQRYYDALRDYYYRLIDLERFVGGDIVFAPPAETPVAHDPAAGR